MLDSDGTCPECQAVAGVSDASEVLIGKVVCESQIRAELLKSDVKYHFSIDRAALKSE